MRRDGCVYERLVGKSAGDAGRGPFTMGDTDELASLFADAGGRASALCCKFRFSAKLQREGFGGEREDARRQSLCTPADANSSDVSFYSGA